MGAGKPEFVTGTMKAFIDGAIYEYRERHHEEVILEFKKLEKLIKKLAERVRDITEAMLKEERKRRGEEESSDEEEGDSGYTSP